MAANRSPKKKAWEVPELPAGVPLRHPSAAWEGLGRFVSATIRDARGKVSATVRQEGKRLTPARREGLELVVNVLKAYEAMVERVAEYEKLFESKAGGNWQIFNVDACKDLPGYRQHRDAIEAHRKDTRRRRAPTCEYCLWVEDGAVISWGHRSKASDRDFHRRVFA